MRKLEIGPGRKKIRGFESLDAVGRPGVDHVGDARALPFPDGSFGLIYASHVIEHLPWYETTSALKEWRRVLAPGGSLEVWTIDAIKVAKQLIEYEETGAWTKRDKWTRHGVGRNPFLWCAGRIFAYAKDDCDDSVFWHRALFTPRHLRECFEAAGFQNVSPMDRQEVRGKDHGFVNLGVRGTK